MQPNEPTTKPAAGGPAGRKSTLGWLTQYGIIIAFLLLCVALTFLNKYFLTPENISNILLQTSINGILAMGMTLMENWLTAHPNEIKGVIGENDEMALGAIQAIKGRSLNVKDFVVVGIDGVPDAINAVKAGEMFSILQDAEGQAAGALDVALRAKIGESYQPKAAVWKEWEKEMPWNGGTEKAYFIPWTVITPENADALLKHQKELISGS